MINWIKSLFGKGRLVYKVTTMNGDLYKVKLRYAGNLATLNHQEAIERVYLEFPYRIRHVEFIGVLSE